jgi:hypothetical protein
LLSQAAGHDLIAAARDQFRAGRGDRRRPALLGELIGGFGGFLAVPQRQRQRRTAVAVDQEHHTRVPGQALHKAHNLADRVVGPFLQCLG